MMAADIAKTLVQVGIKLRSYDIGRTHRAPCPRCDRGPRDDALAVTIHAADDVVWTCHRCKWANGWRAYNREHSLLRRSVNMIHGPYFPSSQTSNQVAGNFRNFLGGGEPVTADDLAGRYLAGRNCPLPQNDVLFNPAVMHPHERQSYPAMICIITDIMTAAPISLHITYLSPAGNGKAEIDRPRLYLPGHRKAGGVVRLHADDEVTMGLIVGEGIETCLSAALEFAPVWSCLDAGNFAAFPLLPGLGGLTALVDNDNAGRAAFEAVRNRYNTAGIEVVEVSTSGKTGADLNDEVRA